MIALVAAAVFAAPPPVARGIELRVAGGELVLQVSAAGRPTWRAFSSGRWMVTCQAAGIPFADEAPASRSATGLVAPARLVVRTGIHPASSHMDVCSGSLSTGDVTSSLPLRIFSARGTALVDLDQGANATLAAARGVASAFATMGIVPPPGSVPGTAALATPGARPPAAPRLGYWSDGAGHALFATRTKAGRVLVAGFDAPDVLSTNVPAYLGGLISKPVPLIPVAAMSAGVTAALSDGAVSFALPAPLLASLGPSQLDPLCLRLLRDGRAESSSGPVRASAALSLPLDTRGGPPDACLLRKTATHRIVARVGLSDAGRRYEELEQARTATIGALQDAALLGSRLGVGLAPTEALQANGPVVALAGPGAVPPPDAVGYWTDGVGHAYAATLASDGRTLWAERDGAILRSNVLLGGS